MKRLIAAAVAASGLLTAGGQRPMRRPRIKSPQKPPGPGASKAAADPAGAVSVEAAGDSADLVRRSPSKWSRSHAAT